MRSISCQTFAGGFDLGAELAGLHMVHKVELPGGFGMGNVLGNRHMFQYDWTHQATPTGEWEALSAEVTIGNPPCSI